MKEIPLSRAVQLGASKLDKSGILLTDDLSQLKRDLGLQSHLGGAIAVAATPATSSMRRTYRLVKYRMPSTGSIDATIDDVWTCTKEHYGLTGGAGVASLGSIPLSKVRLGYPVTPGASRYTNIVSHVGLKFFPLARLPSGSLAANLARDAFGTIRIFGIIGRSLPYAAIGLAVFDVLSIGLCAYEARHGR